MGVVVRGFASHHKIPLNSVLFKELLGNMNMGNFVYNMRLKCDSDLFAIRFWIHIL